MKHSSFSNCAVCTRRLACAAGLPTGAVSGDSGCLQELHKGATDRSYAGTVRRKLGRERLQKPCCPPLEAAESAS